MVADKNSKTGSTQPATAPVSTPEIDWSSIFAQLFSQPSAGAPAAARGAVDASPASGILDLPTSLGAHAVETPSGLVLAFPERLNPPGVLEGARDVLWANIAHNYFGNDPLAQVVDGRGTLDGPGFRSIGAFLYYDENGGGFDGTETLLAELRPAANGFSEIIFF